MAISSQQQIRHRMKSAAGDLTAFFIEKTSRPVLHFPGSLAGKSQQQNIFRRNPLLHQVSQPVNQGAGLAAAGAGNHHHRSVNSAHRLELGRIQLIGIARALARARLFFFR